MVRVLFGSPFPVGLRNAFGMLPPPRSLTNTATCLAASPTAISVDIRGSESVAVDAMRFSKILCSDAHSPTIVLSVPNRLQVCGVYAMAHTAQVIELKAIGDWSDKQLVRDAVCAHVARFTRTSPDGTVAVGTASASPEPACLGELNLGVKPLEQGKLASHLGLILQGVARPGVLALRPLSIVPDRGCHFGSRN